MTLRLISLFLPICFIINGSTNCSDNVVEHDKIESKPGFLVLIDPAHGGRDPGGIADSWILEKDLVLSIAQIIVDSLLANQIPARLSRPDDSYLSTPQRLHLAKKVEADLLISLHLNLGKVPLETGWRSYHQTHDAHSLLFDQLLHEMMRQMLFVEDLGSQAGEFHILTHSSVPTVMVDLGYISNSNDLCLLRTPAIKKMLAGIYKQAIQKFQQTLSAKQAR
ncbi:N-acetylmuramoyl-L-alanine amidase [candidate division KSB1 bacterium]|nr:N-acetylmuramoyl-L-alanine amidase [candidate division KSB1 bacterium]